MFNLKVVALVFLYLQEGSTIDASSPCRVQSSKVGPLKSSKVIYKKMEMERILLAGIKSVVTQSQSTLSSCAVICSNRAITSTESCNIYYVEAGQCIAGIMDSPQEYASQPGSSPTLVTVNVNAGKQEKYIGELVNPVIGTASSAYAGRQVKLLWDGIIGYDLSFASNAFYTHEYVQLDFGTCDLTFVQFIIFGEPQQSNSTLLEKPARYANIEIRVGNLVLTDNGQTRSTNPLCKQYVGTPPLNPTHIIFKCRKQLKGRYVTIQRFSGIEMLVMCEVYSYAF